MDTRMDQDIVNRALLIAYHYPPVQISSGVQRTLAFSQGLPANGWQPMVLTAHPRAYETTNEGQLKDIPPQTIVARAQAWDTARHLSISGRYLDVMALPDRWSSWWLGAVLAGWRLIRRQRPSVIFSTYPIATAHLIGLTLHRLTGLPWVADFRDSMTEDGYPRESRRRRFFLWLEKKTIHACSKAIFTTPRAIRMYRERYPEIPEDRWQLIPNGYNEDIFADVEREQAQQDLANEECGAKDSKDKRLTLVHSGVLYPSERDPRAFFAALAELKHQGIISSESLTIVLRATGHDSLFQPMLVEQGIDDIVQLEPGIDYRAALAEMLRADGLLIFQASNCNHQIPAKLYEYFRAQKPVMALTDAAGDTAATLKEAGLNCIASLNDQAEIAATFHEFLIQVRAGSAEVADVRVTEKYSRQAGAITLARLFDEAAVCSSKINAQA